jgi:hypothetical protein
MAFTMQGKSDVFTFLAPFAATSDGKTGSYVDYNGFNRAFIACMGGIPTTGDSDDTCAFQLHRIDDIAAASAAASDHVDITAGTLTLGPGADSDASFGIEFFDLDLIEHGMDNGCLNITATPSVGGVIPVAATIQLYNKSGKNSDTAMTITVPASS